MKKVIALIAILVLTLCVATGYAQVRKGSFTFSPTIGGYTFEGNEDTESGISLGLRAGYNFTRYVGVEGFVHWVPTNLDNPAFKVNHTTNMNFIGYGIEGIFNILPNGALVPFLAVGVGGVHYSEGYQFTNEANNDKFAADYGAGVKYFLSDNVALRADVRHVIPFDDRHNNLLYTVGLNFAFGGEKKVVERLPEPVPAPAPAPVAPVVVDSDNDGVPDNLDKCPATPAGVAVDAEGCPLDSDKDGVYDFRDKCPGTPAGVKVDNDGCPPPVVEEVKPQAAAAPEILEKGRTTLKVLFDTNKADIKKNSLKDVDNLVAVMKQYPDLNVTIEGHTDSVGSDAYNKKLSQRRADAVMKYMVDKGGISANRLKAVGFGEEKPIADNATKAGKAQNRRVEAATADYIIKK